MCVRVRWGLLINDTITKTCAHNVLETVLLLRTFRKCVEEVYKLLKPRNIQNIDYTVNTTQ